jgi:hypothetical protein
MTKSFWTIYISMVKDFSLSFLQLQAYDVTVTFLASLPYYTYITRDHKSVCVLAGLATDAPPPVSHPRRHRGQIPRRRRQPPPRQLPAAAAVGLVLEFTYGSIT